MNIERFEVPGLAHYSYIVSSGGQAAIIDPIRDTGRYTRYLDQRGLMLASILETHIHADFASGSKALAEETDAELVVSAYDEGEHYRYGMPHRSLHSGESVVLGSVRLEALHTPGHTPEHLSFILFDMERSHTEPVALFSGDFLFVGSLGRPDLLGEDAKNALAKQLYDSLHSVLSRLPDSVQVYPGHGAGSLCGAGMSDRAESTLGYERRTNRLFQLDESAFMGRILGTVPPMPSYYPRMKALNACGAGSVQPLPGCNRISPTELQALMQQQNCIVLDLRRPEAFGGAHIRGAISIGAGQNLSLWAGWLLEADSRIVLANDKGDDEDARRSLVRVGLDNIVGFLDGGMPAWIGAGFDFERTTQVSVGEVRQRGDSSFVLDVRSDAEWETKHIPGAEHVMLGNLVGGMSRLPNNKPIIAVCGSGYRSSIAASVLTRAGFEDVCSMNGGMTAWTSSNCVAPSV